MTDSALRLIIFLSVLFLMGALEALWPARKRFQSRGRRWATNLAMGLMDMLVLRWLFPLLAVGVAYWAEARGFGLLNHPAFSNGAPNWAVFIITILCLDMLIYWQHVASHHIPLLWRFHKVHHTDRDLDVSSALRFHPVEIIASMGFKMGCVLLLGASPDAVIMFEILLNGCAMFNHANLKLPSRFERILRLGIVTPKMHRVHHSVHTPQTNSNYGFSTSLWDRVFMSYQAPLETDFALGLEKYQNENPSHLGWSLLLPLRR